MAFVNYKFLIEMPLYAGHNLGTKYPIWSKLQKEIYPGHTLEGWQIRQIRSRIIPPIYTNTQAPTWLLMTENLLYWPPDSLSGFLAIAVSMSVLSCCHILLTSPLSPGLAILAGAWGLELPSSLWRRVALGRLKQRKWGYVQMISAMIVPALTVLHFLIEETDTTEL